MVEEKMVPTFGLLQKWEKWPPWADPIPWPWVEKLLDKKQLVNLTNLRIKFNQQILETQLKFNQQLVKIQKDFLTEFSRMFG